MHEAKRILLSVDGEKTYAEIFTGAEKYSNIYAMALQVVLNTQDFNVGKPDGFL